MSKERATRHDAEQVPLSVSELLAKHQSDEESGPPSRPTTMYRTIAVLAGFLLLCAAVTASTAALSGPRSERSVPGSATTSITGADALHPDMINTSIEIPPLDPAPSPADQGGQAPARSGDIPESPDPGGTPKSLPQYPPATPEDSPAPGSDPATPDPGDPPAAPSPPPDNPDDDPGSGMLNSSLGPILGTVTTFYEIAPTAPRQAFDLLDPQMQGSGYDEFRQAWAGVRRAVVEDIRPDGPHAAQVIVRLEQDDGAVLRTLQRVLVTPGMPPRIADAQLLSASRS